MFKIKLQIFFSLVPLFKYPHPTPMSDTINLSGTLLYFIAGILSWLAAVAAVVYWLSNKESQQEEKQLPDTKTRMWRKLQTAYKELFPSFTIEEKKAMTQLLEITTANVELFKNKPQDFETSFRKRTNRDITKKVAFKL